MAGGASPVRGLPGGDCASPVAGDYAMNADSDVKMGDQCETLPSSPADEARIIERHEQNNVQEGDQMHIISTRWYTQWRDYTRQDPSGDTHSTARPGKIDNHCLMDNLSKALKENLKEGEDFVIVTANTWASLKQWYGGGPDIPRTAFLEGLAPNSKRPRVTLYPVKLEIWFSKEKHQWLEADKSWTVAQLKAAACDLLQVAEADVTIWDYFQHEKYKDLEDNLQLHLEGAKILDNQAILLDDKANPLPSDKEKSSSPLALTWDTTHSTRQQGRLDDSSIDRAGARPGMAGLQNLGNTCFMNSSLQCLMHAVPFLKVFLSGAYKADINTVNPLGMKGVLATAFGGLMDRAWQGGVGVVVPRGFKARIAQYAPQFSGYQQHDSQEFLAFLLDGLHEDINRIKQKPYIEEHDGDGEPDEKLAAEAWANYRARNDSAIVDHFQGLYKSTLVCPKCNYSSRKFDPFMYLSLPLPESRVRQLLVVLLRMDGSGPPVEYGIEVPQTGTLRDVYQALCRAAQLRLAKPELQMVAAQIESMTWCYNLEVYEDPKTRITELRCKKGPPLLVYMYGSPEEGPAHEGNKQVSVLHRTQRGRYDRNGWWSAPLLFFLPERAAYDMDEHVFDHSKANELANSTSYSFNNTPNFEVDARAPIWRHIHRALTPMRVAELPVLDASMGQPGGADQEMTEPGAAAGAAEGGGPDPGSPAAGDQPEASADIPMVPAVSGEAAGPGTANAAAAAAGTGEVPGQAELLVSGIPLKGLQQQQEQQDEEDVTLADRTPGPGEGFGEGGGLDGSRAPSCSGSWGSSNAGSGAAAAGDLEERDDLGEFDSAGGEAGAAGDPYNFPPDPGTPGRTDEAAPGDGRARGPKWGDQQDAGANGPVVAPFDMWSAQGTSTPAEGTLDVAKTHGGTASRQSRGSGLGFLLGENGAAAAGPPYRLWLGNDKGQTEFTTWSANTRHPNAYHDTFVMDWYADAAQRMPKTGGAAAVCVAGSGKQQQDGLAGAGAAAGAGAGEMDSEELVEVVGGYDVEQLKAPQVDASADELKERASGPPRPVCLEQCVQAFLQPEQLSHEDEWYCPKCKEFVQADKKLDLWSLPEVLVVHLKRFSYTRWHRDKLDTPVHFPLSGLDLNGITLSQDQASPPVYDCFAVSNHFGGLGGGHYTAYAQQPDDKKWYCFDDSRVDETSAGSVQSSAAYVLFYRRRQEASRDPPDLLQHLLILHQQQKREEEEAAATAAAEAAGAGRGGTAGDGSGPDVTMDAADEGDKPVGTGPPAAAAAGTSGTAAAAVAAGMAAAAAAAAAAKSREKNGAEGAGGVEMDVLPKEGPPTPDAESEGAGGSQARPAAVFGEVPAGTCSGDSGPGPAGLKGLAAHLPSEGVDGGSSRGLGSQSRLAGEDGNGGVDGDASSTSISGAEAGGVAGGDSSSSGGSSGRAMPIGSWEGRRGSGSVKPPEQQQQMGQQQEVPQDEGMAG